MPPTRRRTGVGRVLTEQPARFVVLGHGESSRGVESEGGVPARFAGAVIGRDLPASVRQPVRVPGDGLEVDATCAESLGHSQPQIAMTGRLAATPYRGGHRQPGYVLP